jgi:Family of unknown function (DUF5343)
MPDQPPTTFVPPYISFSQLENVFERMRNEGVPARVDRSYLSSWSGSAQAQFLKAARSLELLDEHGRPSETLKRLVSEPEARPTIIGELLHAKYPDAIALGKDATQSQLDEVFRNYDGISGSTTRKAITFYLHAAKFAGIQLSPFFKAGRASGGGGGSSGTRRAARPRTAASAEGTTTPPPPIVPTLHPAILTLTESLPEFEEAGVKPEFPSADRKAWFAYAKATFDLIYAYPDGDGPADV